MLKRISLTCVTFCMALSCAVGQTPDKFPGQVNIASPNAAALGKFGDIPVSYHTGVPNISIPLYTLKEGELTLPISVSYHAGGIKVDEMASNVGLGWALNAGGVITRTVKDKPDEKQVASTQQTFGYFSDYGLATVFAAAGPMGAAIPVETFDGEPDLFHFNFNGYSGQFHFNDDRTPVLVPEQDFKIEYSYTSGQWFSSPGVWGAGYRNIESFVITTPDGTKYYFGIPTIPTAAPYCDPIEVNTTFSSMAGNGMSYSEVISSWYLYKIVSKDGNSLISLSYERDTYSFYSFTNSSPGSELYVLIKNFVAGVRLSQISSSSEVVTFQKGVVRQDVSSWDKSKASTDENITDVQNTTARALGGLSVQNKNGTCVKRFVFSHDFFQDNTTPVQTSSFAGLTYDTKRLRLNSIQQITCDSTQKIPPYTFSYFSEQVPRIFSLGRDHWGYYNGVTTNQCLFPPVTNSVDGTVINGSWTVPLANRDSSWPAMRGGTLQTIVYPTGGSTTFGFEPHKFSIYPNGQTTPIDAIVGGLRIQSMSNYDPNSNQTITTNYSYADDNPSLSSGVLYSRPVYVQWLRNDWWGKTNFLSQPYPSDGCIETNFCPCASDPTLNCACPDATPRMFSLAYAIISDNPIRPMETTQGSHIGYGKVTVSQAGNGFSVYRYFVTPPWQVSRDNVAITSIINPSPCDSSIPNFPAAPLPTDFMRGELKYEGHFNSDSSALHEKTYVPTYVENPVTTPGHIVDGRNIGPNGSSPGTFYELKTARKSSVSVTEVDYQPGGNSLTKQTTTSFGSAYHNQPTTVTTSTSDGKTVVTNTTYTFDLRVPVLDNISHCVYGSASFLNFLWNTVYPNLIPNDPSYTTFQRRFTLADGYTDPVYAQTLVSFLGAVMGDRLNYVNCRRTNYTNVNPPSQFQSTHDSSKAAADDEFGSVLWAQDNYINVPIEINEQINGNLTKATYTQYTNVTGDQYGVDPKKTMKIDMSNPASSFGQIAVNYDGKSLVKDSHYADDVSLTFSNGRLINAVQRNGVTRSYDWGYNGVPILEAVNSTNYAVNKLQAQTVTKNQQTNSSGTGASGSFSITTTSTGSVTVSIPTGTPPPGYNLTTSYTIVGPNNTNISSSLCSGSSCSPGSNSATYNLQPGQYTITYSNSSNFTVSPFSVTLSTTYSGTVMAVSGPKEFFFDGFEENGDPGVATGSSHTGRKYWSTNYSTAYVPPNSRSYKIQWWNLVSGQWIFNEQPYTNGMLVTGPVDDVRIFPTDAQITTYTYEPGVGMTSQTDTNGVVSFYEYDSFNRLKCMKDNSGSIIRAYEYTYQTNSSH